MAPKNQGIMTVDPFLVERLIGTKPKTLGLGESIDKNIRGYTDNEFFGKYGSGGTKYDEFKRKFAYPYKWGANIVTNIPGFFKGIGQYMDQESDAGKARRAADVAKQMQGVEFGLPTGKTTVKGKQVVPEGLYDRFEPGGQERLISEQFPAGLDIDPTEELAIAGESDLGPEFQETINKRMKEMQDADVIEEEKGIAGELTSEDVAVDGADTAAKKATVASLDEILKETRPGVRFKKYEEYIKEFGDATGLDISGDPDTKQALMSFGLALMQNRAGKGFNISNILRATGEAGEAAMPEFSKAVSEAKAIRAKAGAYALAKTDEDKKAAMNRKNYVVVPRGEGGIKGLAANMDKTQNLLLNSYELSALTENEKFTKNYEIIPSSQYEAVITAALKTPELGKKYMTSKGEIELFEGAEGMFKIPVQFADKNYKGTDPAKKPAFIGDTDAVMNAFKSMRKDIDRGKAQFKDLVDAIEAPGGVTVWKQGVDALTNLGAAFGVDFKDEQTSTGKIKLILNRIQAKYAPQILGETGKTISDADRARVAQIVGELKVFQNPAELKAAISRIFDDIIGGQERKLQQGLRTFNSLIGQKVQFESGVGLNEEEKKRLAMYENRRKGIS
tara:strand:+ start:1518 stop:3371 length:1854 start_codon:yes stop_codon:yes gene_type:complete